MIKKYQTRNKPVRCFTLIEVVVALALTALLAGLTGRLALGSLRTRNYAQDVATRLQRNQIILDTIGGDLESLLTHEANPISVFGSPHQVLQLTALATVPDPGHSLHTPKLPAMVRYRLIRNAVNGHAASLTGQSMRPVTRGLRLVREVIDLTRHNSPPFRETLAHHVEAFVVEVYYKHRWSRSYTAHDQDIEAIRMRIKFTGDDEPLVRTYLLTVEAT